MPKKIGEFITNITNIVAEKQEPERQDKKRT
jgi:hypothetical protein